LKELELTDQSTKNTGKIIINAQISKYLDTEHQYLLISVAKPSPPVKGRNSSVTIGMVLDETLKNKINLLNNEELTQSVVNHTCERCRLDNCADRVAAPKIWQEQQAQSDLKNTLTALGIG
jgi:hypothetical protein